jgi:hypothetical protein
MSIAFVEWKERRPMIVCRPVVNDVDLQGFDDAVRFKGNGWLIVLD